MASEKHETRAVASAALGDGFVTWSLEKDRFWVRVELSGESATRRRHGGESELGGVTTKAREIMCAGLF